MTNPIRLDNDSGSGDGNSCKIHWVCRSNGKTPTTCRGGGSAQFPSYAPSHGKRFYMETTMENAIERVKVLYAELSRTLNIPKEGRWIPRSIGPLALQGLNRPKRRLEPVCVLRGRSD